MSKVRNGPQEESGDREEAWGQLGVQTGRKWAAWVSRRESCLSFSVLSSALERTDIPGSGKPTAMKMARKQHNQL